MSEIVCVRTFPSRSATEVARSVLEMHGIAATVSAADAGYDITFASGGGQLFVDKDSAARAEEILASTKQSSPLTVNVSEVSEPEWRRSPIWIGLVLLTLALVVMAF